MRAISIRQPWAALIVLGLKNIENRTWRMPAIYEGETVLVHSGLEMSPGWEREGWFEEAMALAEETGTGLDYLRELHVRECALACWGEKIETTALGGILGAVRFGKTMHSVASPWADQDSWHWPVREAWPLPFHPCKGALGFFDVDYPHDTGRPSWVAP